MRKLAQVTTFLLTLLIFISFTPAKAYGFGLSRNSFDNIYGISCGKVGGKCCQPTKLELDLTFNNGFIDTILTPVRFPLESAFNVIIGGIVYRADQFNKTISGGVACVDSVPSTQNDKDPSCTCVQVGKDPLLELYSLCNNVQSANEKKSCQACLTGNNQFKKGGVWTGLGCIYGDAQAFIQNTLLGWGIGLAGAIALLCIIYAAFLMETSQGNPERVKKAQEMLTSCIMGLLLIIFSVFILRVIGVDILRIYGFGR